MTEENINKVITHFEESGQESQELFLKIINMSINIPNDTEFGNKVHSLLTPLIIEIAEDV
mgnify:CR=1 FL=1